MAEPKVVHATCVVERSFPCPPEVVFRALSEPDKMRRWYTDENSSELEEFTAEFREGGWQRLRYKLKQGTPIPGMLITNEGMYQEIVPNERVVSASTMKLGERRISASQVTMELIRTKTGTDLICTHQGAFFEGSDGPERREQGWNRLMDNLVKVVQQDNAQAVETKG